MVLRSFLDVFIVVVLQCICSFKFFFKKEKEKENLKAFFKLRVSLLVIINYYNSVT